MPQPNTNPDTRLRYFYQRRQQLVDCMNQDNATEIENDLRLLDLEFSGSLEGLENIDQFLRIPQLE
jgi:hypothetical protein